MFLPYSLDNELLKNEYNKNNYQIIYNPRGEKGKCIVYFSGNGLYVADREESFRQKIQVEDRYEWKTFSAKRKPEKEIFIRDIWLSWYALGINRELSTIYKVAEWLNKETSEFDTTLVGNSAGGYMAVNCGCLIAREGGHQIRRIFSFCGQFSLLHHNNHTNTNPLLIEQNDVSCFECYNSLKLLENTPVYYIYSAGVDHDCEQAGYAETGACVRSMAVDSKRHGTTINTFDYPYVLSMSNEDLDAVFSKLSGELVTADELSIFVFGRVKFEKRKLSAKFYQTYRRLYRRFFK